MYLEHVDIRGFRGINRLSIGLQQTTALIGENAWGKTSLLRALWCLLGQGEVPYQFAVDDFHHPAEPDHPAATHLQIILTFSEYRPDMSSHSGRLSRLAAVWVRHRDGFHRIHYRAAAELTPQGEILSEHGFLDENGHELPLPEVKSTLHQLMLMNPVLRLRDARATRTADMDTGEGWEKTLDSFSSQLMDDESQIIDPSRLRTGVQAVQHLMAHYLNSVPPIKPRPRSARDIVTKPANLRGLGDLHALLRSADHHAVQLAMAGLGAALLQARGDREIEAEARPILILEDPESRLHPTMLALAWGLLEQLPGQKILTTNSGDLLASMPLGQIRRLVRHSNETRCYRLNDEQLSSDDLRRIAFHVRINRPMSLFARCWLLVEGETEIWLLSELAHISGINLRGEGIRIIEFAQCGTGPLIKAARDFGIQWHLLADGDEAGSKYASGVRSQLRGDDERERLTLLPAKDIEHFLFHHGFDEVYRREAGNNRNNRNPWLSATKLIDRAISHRSKPGMALAIVEEAERRGQEAIPLLLRQMFSKILALARSQG